MDNYIQLTDVAFEVARLIAVGRATVPQTMHTNESYALLIYLVDVREPITQIFELEEERDKEFDKVVNVLKTRR